MAQPLNHLGHLAAEVRTKGGLTERWDVLINVYFRGDDRIGQQNFGLEDTAQTRAVLTKGLVYIIVDPKPRHAVLAD